jgi:hypothetical protein
MTWRLTGKLAARLAAYDYDAIISDVPGLRIALVVGLVIAFSYFVASPLLRKKLLPSPLSNEVIWSDKRFVITAIVVIYISIGVILVLVVSQDIMSVAVEIKVFRAWLTVPLFFLSLTPFGGAVLGLVALRHFGSKKSTSKMLICGNLLQLLKDWPTSESEQISSEVEHRIAKRLRSISDLIRRLYFRVPPKDQSEEWAADQMKRAADNLLVCNSWLYIPQRGTLESIRHRVIHYCNAFLTDCLHELPRELLTEEQGLKVPKRRQRVWRTVSFVIAILVYCMAPVVVYFIIRDRLPRIVVPDSLLLLLYSLWIAAGLYAYLAQTSENAGAAFLDLLKGVISR